MGNEYCARMNDSYVQFSENIINNYVVSTGSAEIKFSNFMIRREEMKKDIFVRVCTEFINQMTDVKYMQLFCNVNTKNACEDIIQLMNEYEEIQAQKNAIFNESNIKDLLDHIC
jgi:hypothetical protein